ncbi:MAG: WG repeat-containing protein, partial [Clostridia bacterium]|nr:WG repeat-containing protein [Clostridia bacterium]
TGEEALGFHYFDHGLLRVVIASYDENGNIKSKRESIINTYGEEVFLPQNYHAVSYLEGIFVVTNGEKFGYVSSNGAWITSPVYDHASPFCEGIAVVTNEDGKKGLIDQTGKVILEPAFDGISSFSAGSALLYSQDLGWYLLSKVKGKFPPSENTEPPTSSEFHTKITITRGPQNTFDYEPDEIIVLPPILSTPSRTTHPSYTAKK